MLSMPVMNQRRSVPIQTAVDACPYFPRSRYHQYSSAEPHLFDPRRSFISLFALVPLLLPRCRNRRSVPHGLLIVALAHMESFISFG